MKVLQVLQEAEPALKDCRRSQKEIRQVLQALKEADPAGSGEFARREACVLENNGHSVSTVYIDKMIDWGVKAVDKERGSCLSEVIASQRPDVVHLRLVRPLGRPYLVSDLAAHCPIVISVDNHVLTCPCGKRLLYGVSLVPCEVTIGLRCLLYPYLHSCRPRHPKQVVANFMNTLRTRWVARRAHKLIVYSPYMLRSLIRSGFPAERVTCLYGIPMDIFLTDVRPRPATNRILYAGRLSREKGIPLLLEASRLLKLPHKMTISGDGPELVQLKRLAARSSPVAGRISFTGWLPQEKLIAMYDSSAVIVVPSIWPEPFGLIGVEAMSRARPIVAFDGGGISSWVRDGVNGYLVKVGDVAGLAAKIELLLKNRALADQMGRRGRRLVEEEFGQERLLGGLLEVYQDAMHVWSRSHVGKRHHQIDGKRE